MIEGSSGNARPVGGDVPWSIRQITDGTSNTLLMGEAAGNYKPWGNPTDWRDPPSALIAPATVSAVRPR